MLDEKIFQFKAELRKMTKANLLKMGLGQKEKNAYWAGYVLFFWSTGVFFFVFRKSWDKGARSKSYILTMRPKMRGSIHKNLWRRQMGRGFRAFADSTEV